MNNYSVPLGKPSLGEEEIKAVEKVLSSGWLISGKYTEEFEARFSEYIGAKYAIAMNSCTSALQVALMVNGIKGEVILPSFTFVASANSVINSGAIPRFADIDFDTCNIDPKSIEENITPQTEAVMVVHFAGQSCDMDAIIEICRKHNLLLIEDSAETIGGEFRNKKTGSFGTGCFSFFPTKNMTTGEGGMLTTNDEDVFQKARALIGHGIEKNTYQREKLTYSWKRIATHAGYNFRFNDILAAIGCEQIKKLDFFNEARREKSNYLINLLANIEEILLPVETEYVKHVYQMFTIKVKTPVIRDQFVTKLNECGIGASVHFFPPVHKHIPYKDYKCELPNTEVVSESIITLPMFPDITFEQLDQIQVAIKNSLFECIRNY